MTHQLPTTPRPMDLADASNSARCLAETVTPQTMAQIVQITGHMPQTGEQFRRAVAWLEMRYRKAVRK